MSSYLSGGGRATYKLESLSLDCIIKSPLSSTSWTSNNSSSSSSPSSTLSESTNSPLAISTRKPRTPRKRPNQTYNEAAAILSTAYPKIFTVKHTTKPRSKLVKSQENIDEKSPPLFEPSDLINIPFQAIDASGFLLNPPLLERTRLPKGFNPFEKPCLSPGEINSLVQCSSEICYEPQENFEAESIVLDEEVTEEGIDSIMRINMGKGNESTEDPKIYINNVTQIENFAYGYPVTGLGFEFGYGMRREFRAFRNIDDGDWWRFPTVNVADLTPKVHHTDDSKVSHVEKKTKKKKKKVENKKLLSDLIKDNPCSEVKTKNHENVTVASDEKAHEEEDVAPLLPDKGLLLKLNYEEVLNTWADKASPFSGDELAGNDVQARLAQIDLFSENGGLVREASVLRYKEKRRTRLFSKKIRYHVRKVNADRRPRMKGRFVRTPNSSEE